MGRCRGCRRSRWRSCAVACLNDGGFAVEGFELGEVDALDVAADAAFSEGERHPRFEVLDDSRLYLGMFVEVEVQAVGEGVHQGFEPRGAGLVLCLQRCGVDEELHAQVLVDLRFAFSLGEAAHRVDVVGFDAVEVVLGLGVLHAEDGVGVGFAVDVGDAPVVADDGDVGRLSFPAFDLGVPVCMEQRGEETRNRRRKPRFLRQRQIFMRFFLLRSVQLGFWRQSGVNSLPAAAGCPPPRA